MECVFCKDTKKLLCFNPDIPKEYYVDCIFCKDRKSKNNKKNKKNKKNKRDKKCR